MQADLRLSWLIAVTLTGWLLYLLAPVLTPFVAAALLAYVGDPLADRLQKLKMPRTLAVAAVFLITFIILALLILLVGPLISAQVGALFDALPEIANRVEQVWLPGILGWLNIESGADVGIGPFLAKYGEMFGSWSGKVLLSVTKSGGALAAAVLSLFLIPIITFYMLRDWDVIMVHLGALVPESQRETVFRLARESDDVLGAFLTRSVAGNGGALCNLFAWPEYCRSEICDRHWSRVRSREFRAVSWFCVWYRHGGDDGCA